MPLSPHEEKALAALEEGLRADDPRLAAVLGATPLSIGVSARPMLLLSTRPVVTLLVALLGLIAAGTLFGNRPAVLAAATGALLLPWMIDTARSTARGPRLADPGAHGRNRRRARTARRHPIGYGALALGVALLLVALVVLPPTGRAVVGLGLTFVVAPCAAVAVMAWTDRRRPR